METAAAILVHTIITRTSGLQQLLVAEANQSPQAAVKFLKPYYEAALALVQKGGVENSAPVERLEMAEECKLFNFKIYTPRNGIKESSGLPGNIGANFANPRLLPGGEQPLINGVSGKRPSLQL